MENDYEQWMRPGTLNTTWGMTNQQWHVTLRKAFRSHLFQMVGSYEMAIFFVVAPFNNENLLVCRQCHNLEQSKECVRNEARWQELRAGQRHRNAVITAKIIKLGLCIATAWARNYASAQSLAQ